MWVRFPSPQQNTAQKCLGNIPPCHGARLRVRYPCEPQLVLCSVMVTRLFCNELLRFESDIGLNSTYHTSREVLKCQRVGLLGSIAFARVVLQFTSVTQWFRVLLLQGSGRWFESNSKYICLCNRAIFLNW